MAQDLACGCKLLVHVSSIHGAPQPNKLGKCVCYRHLDRYVLSWVADMACIREFKVTPKPSRGTSVHHSEVCISRVSLITQIM